MLISDTDSTSAGRSAASRGGRTPDRRRSGRRLGRRLRRDPLAGVRLPRRRLDLPRGRRSSPPTTTRPRTSPSGSPPRSRTSPGSASAARRSPRPRSTSRSSPTCAQAELLAFPLLFLLSLLFFRSLVAALLPLLVGGLAIVGTFLMLRARQRDRLDLDLRPQPRHRPRARAGDRLQPVHRLALPRGDRPLGTGLRGDAADDGDRRAHGPVQLPDRRRGARLAARLPAALPLLDGDRRGDGRADRRRDRAGRLAGGALAARRAGQLALPRLPPPPRRSRRPAGLGGVLVPAARSW